MKILIVIIIFFSLNSCVNDPIKEKNNNLYNAISGKKEITNDNTELSTEKILNLSDEFTMNISLKEYELKDNSKQEKIIINKNNLIYTSIIIDYTKNKLKLNDDQTFLLLKNGIKDLNIVTYDEAFIQGMDTKFYILKNKLHNGEYYYIVFFYKGNTAITMNIMGVLGQEESIIDTESKNLIYSIGGPN